MSDWQHCTLGELVKFKGGSVFPKDAQGLTSGDLPFAKVSDMTAPANWRSLAGAENWLSVDQAKKLKATIHEPGAVAFAKIGIALTYNRRRQIVRPTLLDNNMMSAKAHPGKIDSKFLYYLLQTIDFNEVSAGSALPYLTIGTLGKIAVSVPCMAEQRNIALLLGSLDDKIELNRRMNETLEAMAQAIFRDWFVDFGPTRRKIDGTTDPVEIMGGLVNDPDRARELADLFPARLGDDGLPEGWSYSSLGEVFDIKIGRTPPRKEQQHFTSAGDGVPWMSIRDMGECGVFIRDTAEGLTPDAVERFRVPVINPDTVVVSFKLTVGRVAITEGHMLSNEAIAHLGPGSQAQSPWFTYLWMQQFDYSRLGSTSSIATAVNSKSIKTIEFPVVGPTLRSAFHDLVDPVFRMIRSKSNEGRNLAATRDLLLPKLMSGEIRLRAAEAVLEAAQ